MNEREIKKGHPLKVNNVSMSEPVRENEVLNITFFNAKSTCFPPINRQGNSWMILITAIVFNKHYHHWSRHTSEILSFILQTWRVLFSSLEANISFYGPQERSVTFVLWPEWMNFIGNFLPTLSFLLSILCSYSNGRYPRKLSFCRLILRQIACCVQDSRLKCLQNRYDPQKCEAKSKLSYFFADISYVPKVYITILSPWEQKKRTFFVEIERINFSCMSFSTERRSTISIPSIPTE